MNTTKKLTITVDKVEEDGNIYYNYEMLCNGWGHHGHFCEVSPGIISQEREGSYSKGCWSGCEPFEEEEITRLLFDAINRSDELDKMVEDDIADKLAKLRDEGRTIVLDTSIDEDSSDEDTALFKEIGEFLKPFGFNANICRYGDSSSIWGNNIRFSIKEIVDLINNKFCIDGRIWEMNCGGSTDDDRVVNPHIAFRKKRKLKL